MCCGDGRRGPLTITEAACDSTMAPLSCRRLTERHPHCLEAGIVREAGTSTVVSRLEGRLCGMIELMGSLPSTSFFSLIHAEMLPQMYPCPWIIFYCLSCTPSRLYSLPQ